MTGATVRPRPPGGRPPAAGTGSALLLALAFLLLLLLLLLLPSARPLAAQAHPTVARGFAPEKAYELGELDSVALFSGNLIIRLPIGPRYPVGGGLSYGLTLLYNAQLWDHERDDVTGNDRVMPGRHFTSGLGWTLSLGQLLDENDPTNDEPGWVYLSPDGGQHRFYGSLHAGEAATIGVAFSRDGTYLRLETGPEPEVHFPDGTVHTFDSHSQPLADGSPRTLHRLTEIREPFFNWLRVDYSTPRQWRITDSQGRSHTVTFEADGYYDEFGPGVVRSVDLAAFDGTRAVYTFTYERPTLSVGCPHNDPKFPVRERVPLLTGVELPDGTRYAMPLADYNTPSGTSCDRLSGLLRGMTLPTLGKVEWDYIDYSYPSPDGENCQSFFSSTVGVLERRLLMRDGTLAGRRVYRQSLDDFQCSPSGTDPAQEMTLLVLEGLDPATPAGFPCGSLGGQVGCTCPLAETGSYLGCTEHKFAVSHSSQNGFTAEMYGLPLTALTTAGGGSWFLSRRTYEYQSGAPPALLRERYVRYEWDAAQTGVSLQHLNQRLAGQRTVYHDDGGRTADVTYSDFDGLGQYRRATTGGTFDIGNVRETFTDYNPGRGTYPHQGVGSTYQPWSYVKPWILGTYDRRTASEGGDTAEERFCFARDAEGYPVDGFLRRRRMMLGGSLNTRDVLEVFTPDGAGNRVREQAYGGDLGPAVPTGSNWCTATLASDAYRVDHTYAFGTRATSEPKSAAGSSLGFKSLDQTIDLHTGLPRSSRDPAGLATTYDYDALGRLTRIRPRAGHDALTQVFYNIALSTRQASVNVIRRVTDDTTSTPLAQRTIYFDDLGRPWHEDTLMPDGTTSRRTTTYNLAGWPQTVSEVNTQGGATAVTSYAGYDPFGRVRRINPPEGTHHQVRLDYWGERKVQRRVWAATGRDAAGGFLESQASRVELYDRQGRLYQVQEPTGAGGALEATRYFYDVGGRLSRVTQGVQSRSFTYDHRGFLLSESHPEKDGAVTYSGYDARGHATRRVDGPFDLTFVYDRAERLTEVAQTGTGGRTLESYAYGNCPTVGVSNRCNGKLVEAVRHNLYPGLGREAAVTERYTYAGRQGRVSARATEVAWPTLPSAEPPQGDLIFADGFESGDTSAWSETVGGSPAPPPPAPPPAGVTFGQAFTWSELGEIGELTYPRCTAGPCSATPGAGRTVEHHYAAGRLTALTEGQEPNLVTFASITYHPNGLVHQISHENGVTVTQQNDPHFRPRPRRITMAGGNRNWDSGFYEYDGAGNVAEMGTDWFVYDLVGRIRQAQVVDPAYLGGIQHGQSYQYDRYGNLLQIQTSANGLLQETRSLGVFANSNRLSAATYDAAGNLTTWGDESYTYGPLGEMLQRQNLDGSWLYAYTADGERLLVQDQIADRQLWTIRDLSGKVLTEYEAVDGTWTLTRDTLYRDGQLLATGALGGLLTHYYLDHLGTPRLLLGPPSTTTAPDPQTAGPNTYLVGRHNYFPFGEEATDSSQNALRHKFTGHERDQLETPATADDLDYMHARYYNPQLGRFLSADPGSSTEPTLPGSWNRYSYAYDNPVRFVDPNGLEPLEGTLLQFFNAFFGSDFASVDIKSGFLAQLVTDIAGADAVTLGEGIYLSPRIAESFARRERSSIALVGHELTHVLQYRVLGGQRFLDAYLQNYNYNRTQGQSHQQAYENIIQEELAFQVREVINDFLARNSDIRSKIQSGQPLSEQDLERVGSALTDAAKSGRFKTGFQFIQGFLVYVEPPSE